MSRWTKDIWVMLCQAAFKTIKVKMERAIGVGRKRMLNFLTSDSPAT